jgi:tRNA A37 threonylcarbamoyladenosine dehydratase
MPLARSAITSALEAKGFALEPKRDHGYYFYIGEGTKTEPIYTKVSTGSKYRTIGDDLVAKIARQLKLTKPQFANFVNCPLTREAYRTHLIETGKLKPDEAGGGT